MTPKRSPGPKPKSAPKSPAPGPDSDPNTLVNVTLPLHYAAVVQNSLERSLQAQGREGARMLLTILDAFALAVGEYTIAQPEEKPDERED